MEASFKADDAVQYGLHLVLSEDVSMCVCVVIPFILDVRLVDMPTGVTEEEGHTGFLHLPSAVLVLIFIARRIQPLFLSLVDREVYERINRSPLVGHFIYLFLFLFFVRKNPSSCDCTGIRLSP